jgi:NAD(P)-dependent dehydrogenase (short-subunit alcohol dehydrogenase family)
MATCAITGANRGIGLELCRQLADRGDDVIAICRVSCAALDRPGIRIIDGIDVATEACIERLSTALQDTPIDVVMNNAGLLTRDKLADMDFQRMRKQYEVNALGPLRVTQALLPNLKAGAKILIVSSRVGSVGDNSSGGNYGYRMSKAAANMAGKNLSIELAGRNIAVGIVHPGFVATDMTGGTGIDPAVAAAGIIERADELNMSNTGSFWHAEGYELPW